MTANPAGGAAEDSRFHESCRVAEARRAMFMENISPALAEREDALPKLLRHENASRAAKLRRTFRLIDELLEAASPYVACKKGCSSCCHMNVTISALEAEQIQRATGRRAKQLSSSMSHPLGEFQGVQCPFLRDGSCSIYEVRPYMCRKHVNFDETAYWCDPQRMHTAELPMVSFSGPRDAYFDVIGPNGVTADIRDFFPKGY